MYLKFSLNNTLFRFFFFLALPTVQDVQFSHGHDEYGVHGSLHRGDGGQAPGPEALCKRECLVLYQKHI